MIKINEIRGKIDKSATLDRMHEAGIEVKAWCKTWGVNKPTLYRVLSGGWGSSRATKVGSRVLELF